MGLFFSYIFLNEINPFETLHTFFIMLNASNDNCKSTTKSSSIKLYILDEIPYFFSKFKIMVIVVCNASENNEWP